jgi:hypothetical protein
MDINDLREFEGYVHVASVMRRIQKRMLDCLDLVEQGYPYLPATYVQELFRILFSDDIGTLSPSDTDKIEHLRKIITDWELDFVP